MTWKDMVKMGQDPSDNPYNRMFAILQKGDIIGAIMFLLEQEGELHGNLNPFDAVENALILLERGGAISMQQVSQIITEKKQQFEK